LPRHVDRRARGVGGNSALCAHDARCTGAHGALSRSGIPGAGSYSAIHTVLLSR